MILHYIVIFCGYIKDRSANYRKKFVYLHIVTKPLYKRYILINKAISNGKQILEVHIKTIWVEI